MTLETIDLLRWAMQKGSLGPYPAGWGLHGEDGKVWHCYGCNAHAVTPGFVNEWAPKDFPHEENCKYTAAKARIR